MSLNRVMHQCVCGKLSDPFVGTSGPIGWFVGHLFFDGCFRTISACSADCVEAAKVQTKAHFDERLRGFFERIDDLKLRRV